jgi:AcrR family transcriptional regulator
MSEPPVRARRARKKPRGKYHHGELRRALLDATLAIVEREGTGALSLSEAARRVGVSPQAVYNHFGSKGDLLAAAAEEAVRGFERRMREANEAAQTEGERFESVGVAYVTFAAEHPAHLRLLSAPELADKRQHPSLLAAYEDAFAVLLGAIAECQRAAVVRAGDARALAVAAWGMVHGVAWLIVDGQIGIAGASDDAAQTARAAVRALFKGLSARK